MDCLVRCRAALRWSVIFRQEKKWRQIVQVWRLSDNDSSVGCANSFAKRNGPVAAIFSPHKIGWKNHQWLWHCRSKSSNNQPGKQLRLLLLGVFLLKESYILLGNGGILAFRLFLPLPYFFLSFDALSKRSQPLSLLTAVVVGVPSLLVMRKSKFVVAPLSSAPLLPPVILLSLLMMVLIVTMTIALPLWMAWTVERAMIATVVICVCHVMITMVTIAMVVMLPRLNMFVSVSSSVVVLLGLDLWKRDENNPGLL